MKVSPKQDKRCHEMLPIDADEKVLAIYTHHVFAYTVPILAAILVIVVLMGLAALTSWGTDPVVAPDYQKYVYGTAMVLSVATVIFTIIPVWLRLQEHIVLTDEAVLQVLQPALFASKVSQTSLERIADVTVKQDFLGTILGYGRLSIETPGEQDNYEYTYLPQAREAAREIIEAHENFAAALESGRLPTTFGKVAPLATQQNNISVDPEEYQAFLRFQQQTPQPGKGTVQDNAATLPHENNQV